MRLLRVYLRACTRVTVIPPRPWSAVVVGDNKKTYSEIEDNRTELPTRSQKKGERAIEIVLHVFRAAKKGKKGWEKNH